MQRDMDDRRRWGFLVAEALDAVQGPRADISPEIMLNDVRRCVDQLAEHVILFADPALNALSLLEELLARLEEHVPDGRHNHDIARLELTQRILQLGQLLFVTPRR